MRDDVGSPLRRRQLQSEGYLFVLDPTQPADRQADSIARFAEQAARIRGVRPGGAINAPLAICLTKLDLLPTLPDFQPGGHADRLYDRLRDIDPTGASLSNDVIDARSDLIRESLPRLFPGWNMLSSVKAFFGRRWKLFPLTPIGLNDLSPDNSGSLAQRMFEPYGVCEPLYWLLEQNGMRILE